MAAGAEAERNRAGMSEPMAKTALPGGPRVRPSLEGLRSLRLEGDQRGASGERPRRARYYGARPALAGGAVLLVLVAYVVAARGPFRPPVVEVSRVVASGGEAGSVSPLLTLTGYVVTRRKYVDLGATVPGRIAWIGVEEGDRFEAGQPLARLDEDELRAQRQLAAATLEAAEARLSELVTGPLPEELARAKAQVDEAAAVLRLAERTLVRDEELAREGIVSLYQLDAARSEAAAAQARWQTASEACNLLRRGARAEVIRSARAEVARSHAGLDQARSRLDQTVVRAPFRGVVLEKVRDVGDSVVPGGVDRRGSGSGILRVASDDDLRIEVEVSEVNLAQVKLGQPARVVLDAWADKVYEGRVAKLLPSANRQKATVKAEVALLSSDALVRPEMGAKVQLMEASDTAAGTAVRLLVPKSAVMPAPGGPTAFVLDGERVRTRRVQLGAVRGDLVEVGSGLAEGQYVVVKGQDKLRDGQRVRRTK